MKKSLKKSIGIVLAALVAVGGLLAGGSFYMLSYALRPDAVMAEKNASSYEYMYAEYPFLAEWADSLRSSGALPAQASGLLGKAFTLVGKARRQG